MSEEIKRGLIDAARELYVKDVPVRGYESWSYEDMETMLKYCQKAYGILATRAHKQEEALRLLLEAKHIKEAVGKDEVYEEMKADGWKLAGEVLGK